MNLHRQGYQVAAHAAHPEQNQAIKGLARFGFLSKGVVYGLLGVLALLAAWGKGGSTTDGEGSLQFLGSGPFGTVLVALVGIGLAGYALWRFIEAIRDPRHVGSDSKGLAKRASYAASGLFNGALAVTAFQLAFGNGSSGGGQQTWIAKAMSVPFGQFLVGAIGVAVVASAVSQFRKAWNEKFMNDLETSRMSAKERTWTQKLGKLGIAARAAVFVIIGVAVTRAAINHSPGQAKGVGEALRDIGQSTWGTALLTIVAAGFVAYAAYMLACTRFRKLVRR